MAAYIVPLETCSTRGTRVAFIYEVPVDPDAENNPHSFMLDIVGYNKRVLEVGCANGFVTKVLSERGCTVVGIELDAEAAAVAEKWAEKVVVGDLDAGDTVARSRWRAVRCRDLWGCVGAPS